MESRGVYNMGSGARACGLRLASPLLVARDLGQGAELVNIKLAQFINVKQPEQGQSRRMCSVMLAVLIIIVLFNDGSLTPACKVLLDFHPNK